MKASSLVAAIMERVAERRVLEPERNPLDCRVMGCECHYDLPVLHDEILRLRGLLEEQDLMRKAFADRVLEDAAADLRAKHLDQDRREAISVKLDAMIAEQRTKDAASPFDLAYGIREAAIRRVKEELEGL